MFEEDPAHRWSEPLIRKEIYEIVSNLNELRSHSLETIGITTNGVALTAKRAEQLFESGLDTVNISMDTLEPMKAEFITRRPSTFHKRAIQSIDNALAAGLRVKVNCVLQRDLNFDEIIPLVELSRKNPISVRFIEFMPFNGNDWSGGKKFVSMREILRVVTDEYGEIDFIQGKKSDVAKRWKIDGFEGDFGIIGSMSTPFCSGCNRIRLTANGRIKTCLFSNEEDDFDLRHHLRSNASDNEILDLVESVLKTKKASHGGMDYLVENREKNRPMTSIGG